MVWSIDKNENENNLIEIKRKIKLIFIQLTKYIVHNITN